MKKMTLLYVLFLSFNLSAQPLRLGLNDLSILIPLPKNTDELTHLVSPSNELLPLSVFNLLPILTPIIDQEKNYQNNLKVIAIRFDPCFSEGFGPQACQAQIRLVWQPIYFKTNSQTGLLSPNTIDTAVHTFYNLNQSEWNDVISRLKKNSKADFTSPLQINPTLLQEGFAGRYWPEIKKIILQHAVQKNLVRATVSTIRMDRVWGFRGFQKQEDGTWESLEIPTLKSSQHPEARVINQAFFIEPDALLNLTEFKGSVTLMDSGNTTWFRLIADSEKFKDTQTEDQIKTALKIAFQLENPNQHNPGTIDCVSCHLAQTVRLWGNKNFPAWDFKSLFFQDNYVNPLVNLKNMSVNPSPINRVRSFGYFNDEPIISQRVINETSEIIKNPL